MKEEPIWLSRQIVEMIHADLLDEHGGAPGIRDDDLIESALARPVNRYGYHTSSDLADLAAGYLYGLVRNHGYIDGNKRVGFAAAATFLLLNDQELHASEPEAYDVVVGVASGEVSETAISEWIRQNTRPSTL